MMELQGWGFRLNTSAVVPWSDPGDDPRIILWSEPRITMQSQLQSCPGTSNA